jgi:RNA polymerase subunit RPABC4/transcription elongation factor Spt4
MPLMACPQCGQNVSSLASVCPNCSYSLREQRLKEGQLGPQITCRKCGQKISAKANVCPRCGVDFPKRTFNLLLVAVPLGLVVVVFAIVKLLPENVGTSEPTSAPPPLAEEPPEITPPQTDIVIEDSTESVTGDSLVRAEPIVARTPTRDPVSTGAAVRSTTRWTANWVNVRRDPSPRAPIEQQLDPGVQVEVGRFQSGFWEVFLDGQRLGYVANSLLLREPPEG